MHKDYEKDRPNQEGVTLMLKRILAVGELRLARRVFNAVARHVPYGIKYGIGQRVRRQRFPYRLIQPGDVVVQIGAPRDLVHSGRSRAVHFARLVGPGGLVVVLEPEPASVAELRRYADRHGLGERVRVVQTGAWNRPGSLGFLSSVDHPAANILEEYEDRVTPGDFDSRKYERIVIPVDTVDNVLRGVTERRPTLVSITTNGAEERILEGMRDTIATAAPVISLAVTGDNYVDHMREMSYELVAYDDRGFTFRRVARTVRAGM